MKTIVVSGASSGIGKTTLVNEIVGLLGNESLAVKIGHGNVNKNKNEHYFHIGTSFDTIRQSVPDTKYLIVESNSILKESAPDLILYIDGKDRKKSAETALRRAHIRSGEIVDMNTIDKLSQKLDMPLAIIRKIIWLTGARPEPVQGVMLAGGKSSRMGREKALLQIGNETMAARIASVLNPLCDSILISIQKGKTSPLDGYPIVYDHDADKGPLMGIYSALNSTMCGRCIVTPCDVPCLNPSLIKKMLSFSDDYDIVVPSFRNGFVESLLGVYKKECCSIIKNQLDTNVLRISELFKLCKTKIVDTEDGSWYVNLNTPDEYNSYCKEVSQ